MELIAGKDNFMFGVYISSFQLSHNFDLTKGPQIFDVILRQITIKETDVIR